MRYIILLLSLIPFAFFNASCGTKGSPSLKAFEKPLAVKDIRAVHREDMVVISWIYPRSEVQKIKGFYIERSESEGEGFKSIAYLRGDASEFVDKDFIIEKDYYYRILAHSLRDVLSDYSPVIKVRPKQPPQRPSGLRYFLMNDAINIEWDNGGASVKYNIYKTYKKGEYPLKPLNSTVLDNTFFKDKIEKNRTVYYAVRPLLDTEIKDEGYASEDLEVNPEDFVPKRPEGIRYVLSDRGVYLIWKENPEAWISGYRIYKKTHKDAEFRLVGESATTSFIDREAPASKTLYYIAAVGPKKEGAASETIEIYPFVER